MSTFNDVLDAARTLTPTDRMRLVDALWEDIPPIEWPLPSEEWIAKAQSRSAEHDEGRSKATAWSDVRARARKRAGLDD
jgi:putative addiction module component (TIGR02574 family)